MGKFDGILLCSDMDDTLLTTDKQISADNKAALEYFMSEGGKFAFATGRVPHGARLALEYIVPNVPVVCFNGAGIYDFNENKLLWEKSLGREAIEVVHFIEEKMPQSGILVCARENVYYCRTNKYTRRHQAIEKMADNNVPCDEITEEWKKVIFMQDIEDIPVIKKLIAESEFAGKYNFIQSSPHYYEVLPKGATKGDAMIELAKMLGIDPARTVGVGDNENDIALVSMAGIGVAVANAMPAVRDAADYITVDNNHSALKVVVDGLADGRIHF